MASFRRALLTLAAPVAALVLAACAALGWPRTITLTEGELNDRLQRRMPLERRVLEVFDVTLPTATLLLLPETNRLQLAVAVRVRERLLGANWQGRLVLDAALRWQAHDQTVRLAQVRVHEFKVETAGAPTRGAVERVGTVLVESVLEDFAVYKLPELRAAQLQGLGVAPGAMTVTARGIEITFTPAAP